MAEKSGGEVQFEEETQMHLHLLSAAVEQIREGIAIADLQGQLLFVNTAFACMHGYAPQELKGRPVSVVHTAEQV